MAWGPVEIEGALDLPPGYSLVSLREHGDAFAHGLAIAAQSGAGTLVCVGRYDLVEFAVVLEPEEPLNSARRAFFAGMNAVAAAVAANAPAQREVSFAWPDTIVLDRQLLGGARLGWPQNCAEGDVPPWLVFGAMLRVADMAHVEAAALSGEVSLMGAGFEMVSTEAIVGSFARHLMIGFDQWTDGGFDLIAGSYLARLSGREAMERRTIDHNGDLLTRAAAGGEPVRTSLVEGLARADWYDPGRRGPGSSR